MELIPIRRALLSVSDKSGLVDLATDLAARGVELLSTGGTGAALRAAGLTVRDVAEATGTPELLSGRVKSLHPRIHGGLLADMDRAEHRADLEAHGIPPIDLLIVNLYPFEATVAQAGVTAAQAVEMIDIGGPALIRAAAKNHRHRIVLTDPGQYDGLRRALAEHAGAVPRTLALWLAGEAFARTAAYDAAIADWFRRGVRADRLASLGREAAASADGPLAEAPGAFPPQLHLDLEKSHDLRYGENPHQPAALYVDRRETGGMGALVQHHGRELSYTNYLDLDAALRLLDEFREPCAVIIKHANPCGVGFAIVPAQAYLRSFATDPLSAFGGILGLNRPCDADTAAALGDTFLEGVLAPAFTDEALRILRRRRNIRLLQMPDDWPSRGRAGETGWELRRLRGGYLVQDADPEGAPTEGAEQVVTRAQPSATELQSLRRAWQIVRHVKSNAILLMDAGGTVGIGCGQTSRVDAVTQAIDKARRGVGIGAGTVLASDAFFPFRDSVDAAAAAGIRAIIQPGGSIRDDESIAAADEKGLAMLFTGRRAFLH